MTKFPQSFSDFSDASSGWGRANSLAAQPALIGYDNLVPVEVDPLNGAEAALVPRHIELQLNFYQRSKTRKSLVSASIKLLDKCTISESTTEIEALASLNPPIYPCESDD